MHVAHLRKISKVAFFGHSNGQFSTYIQDYALHTHIKDFCSPEGLVVKEVVFEGFQRGREGCK